MKSDRFSLSFKIFYFVYLGAIGTFMPYINVYLEKSAGLSGSQIGLITALSLILGVCIIPIWGVVGDKTKKYNALVKFSIAGALVMVALYYKAATYPMIIICAIGLEMVRLGTMPMADTLATNYCHKTGGNYGFIRAMGSLGYMLASMLVGFLADAFGLDGPLFATYAVLLVLSFGISFGFPKDPKKEEIEEEDKVQKGSFKTLLTNKNFIFILLLTMLTSVIVDSAVNYGGNHLVTTLGGSDSSISWMTFATVLPEVAFLTMALKVMKRIGFKNFYLLAIASMILRFAVYSFAGNIYVFLGVSVVHCLGVATVTVGNLTFIRNSVNPAVLGTAITLFNAAISVGRAIFGYIYGIVYEYGDSYMIFMISTALFVVAFLLVLRTNRFEHLDKNKEEIA